MQYNEQTRKPGEKMITVFPKNVVKGGEDYPCVSPLNRPALVFKNFICIKKKKFLLRL